jgi:hypothetical protein
MSSLNGGLMGGALMIGGVFLLSHVPAALAGWYRRHLGWDDEGIETSPITVGADAEGEGKFARLRDPESHRIELWQHL